MRAQATRQGPLNAEFFIMENNCLDNLADSVGSTKISQMNLNTGVYSVPKRVSSLIEQCSTTLSIFLVLNYILIIVMTIFPVRTIPT